MFFSSTRRGSWLKARSLSTRHLTLVKVTNTLLARSLKQPRLIAVVAALVQ